MALPLLRSMRLRTLPLSLAGVMCGGQLAAGISGGKGISLALTMLTACALQVLSNLSNEMGDYRSGVDCADRQGPAYGMASGLTERQLWHAINWTVVACVLSGLAMVWVSGSPWWITLVGAAAIWAATHYTLGKKPYGYRGFGDIAVFIFFGLVSVLGSYYVMAHTLSLRAVLPACGVGLLSVAVLNVNNIRDMSSDKGIRRTIPLRIGERGARWYQTVLVVAGAACFCPAPVAALLWGVPLLMFAVHLVWIWTHSGKSLDPALPMLVLGTFLQALLYGMFMR